jgi:hypothetical protein
MPDQETMKYGAVAAMVVYLIFLIVTNKDLFR